LIETKVVLWFVRSEHKLFVFELFNIHAIVELKQIFLVSAHWALVAHPIPFIPKVAGTG